MLDARYSHLYFYQSLNRLQRGISAIAELLVIIGTVRSLWTWLWGRYHVPQNAYYYNYYKAHIITL